MVEAAREPGLDRVGHVIVGSSPFHLVLGIELLTRRERDARVVVVEAADVPGGAWRRGEVFGIPDIELGTHYVENDTTAYGVLERCGVRLVPMEPRPRLIVAAPVGATLPDRVKNLALYGYGSLRRNRSFDRPRHDATVSSIRSLKRVSEVVWRHPPAGCVGLVADLARRFTDLGGELHLGRRVVSLHEDDGTVACGLDDGSTIVAGHVHVTNNTTGIQMDGLSAFDAYERTNVLVALEGAPRPFSYVQVKGDPVLHAVSDIGRYASLPNGSAVISAQLRPDALDGHDPDDVGFVIDRLRALRLLSRTDVVTAVHPVRHRMAGRAGEEAWRAATAASSRVTARRPEVLYTSLAEFAQPRR